MIEIWQYGNREIYQYISLVTGANLPNSYVEKYPNSDPRDMHTTKARLSDTKIATPRSIRIKLRRFINAWERENHTSIPDVVKYSMAPVRRPLLISDQTSIFFSNKLYS